MSGDHNMNQTDSGWRKRQIALNKKAENARELGLDYEPVKSKEANRCVHVWDKHVWPTTQGDDRSCYKCRVCRECIESYVGPIPEIESIIRARKTT